MNNSSTFNFTAILLAGLLAIAHGWPASPGCPSYSGVVLKNTAHDTAGLEETITKYRSLLGGSDNGNEPGPKSSGHRSINWDAPAVPFNMPFDFFKATVTRGAEFHTFGNEFAVSNPPASSGITDDRFSSINPNFPHIFTTFSSPRLFSGVKSNDILTIFSVPTKTNTRATVSGFGAIFTNVVNPRKTKMTYFDKNNCPIVTVYVQPKKLGLSFAGIKVTHKNGKRTRAAVASVRLTLGTTPISAKWGSWKNFVVLDDLIYGEPRPIRE